MRRKAERGDAWAMKQLGYWYANGEKVLPKDKAQGFVWYKRAADLDYPSGPHNCGIRYLHGEGAERNAVVGALMLGRSAEMGKERSCYSLGLYYRDGRHGFPKDEAQVHKWFRKMETCKHKRTTAEYREYAAKWLREHPERS